MKGDGFGGGAGERHQRRFPGRVASAHAAGAKALGEQLIGVATGRGDAEPGRAHVGNRVVDGDVCPVVAGVHALHLQLGRHSEPQCQSQRLRAGVHVGIEQARQQRPATGVDNLRTGRRIPADRDDLRAVDNDGGLLPNALAVEDAHIDDGGGGHG